MRVVATTFLVSALVVGVIGLFVVAGIRAGLLSRKVSAATGVASTTTAELRDRISTNADSSTPEDQLVYNAVVTVGTRAQSPGGFDLRVGNADGRGRSYVFPDTADFSHSLRDLTPRPLPTVTASASSSATAHPGTTPSTGTAAGAAAAPAGCPPSEKRWTYSDDPLQPNLPALLITDCFLADSGNYYSVDYVFKMDSEVDNLNLVQNWVWATEAALVLLLVLISWLVTRQVVTPVRMAARTAERLSAGRLHERMDVKGQDDLARLASSFNKMAVNLQQQIGQLEELSRVQRRFVSDVSHELRTPLTTVRMAADLLHSSRASFEPDVARSAELLQRELDRFEALLVDLLEISRYDAGAAVLDAEAVDVLAVVRRVVDACSRLAENRQAQLLVQLPAAPVIAEVEARRIERILRNLIVNAIEHSDGGPVEITVAATEEAVAIGIRDYGVGMTREAVAHVFERFWRADPARSRTTGGTGLGLSIALEDAHLHGGWLQVWGEPSAGAHFRLTLPRRLNGELHDSPLPVEPLTASPPPPPIVAVPPIPEESVAPRRSRAARSRAVGRGTVVTDGP
ncbi:MAG: two-component system, OmpR family, sensor histidine kinase MtrB, partial [Frankiaceae bacterium]|nr:two-component system, OmpR family, sensor histidine kinase MtrB [Frankiaceae bacterium]